MVNELYGLAATPYVSFPLQLYGLDPNVPFHEQTDDVPFSRKNGQLFDGLEPSLTTNDCLVGIAKYLLKS